MRVGETAYMVRGDQLWEVEESGRVLHDEPRNISTVWPGLPRSPDAGFTWHNGLSYIFIGEIWWLELFVRDSQLYLA